MANYNSSYTGVLIDDAIAKVIAAKNAGGIVSSNDLSTTLSSYLTISSASSTYLTKTNASSIYLSKTDASSTYLTQTNASNTYLTLTNASSTYLSKTDASDTYMLKTALLNIIYPIGAIYISVDSTDPGTFIGGTWELIEDTFLLSAGSTYTAGDTGGEAEHILITDETPAHTHTRGTMEITGWFKLDPTNGWIRINSCGGAFTKSGGDGIASGGSNDGGSHNCQANFTASRTWSGETSSVGGGAAHNNMPPYLVVYMWKRVA